ncbi:SLAP domain-containing protein [Lactobacillus sp. ESL0681]|uniref:SLAP domain-containing protein n=1 Tax=Lactobacillus sp. ESL0681 TaxID=2983211 RepID=UPI0023FA3FA2|nr:SLAP domain-containing protein [Lactobacillus sp. ESL0681]WEV40161.1 SLAP domain-containing protein [Lactobacillus sp. ESL0681]
MSKITRQALFGVAMVSSVASVALISSEVKATSVLANKNSAVQDKVVQDGQATLSYDAQKQTLTISATAKGNELSGNSLSKLLGTEIAKSIQEIVIKDKISLVDPEQTSVKGRGLLDDLIDQINQNSPHSAAKISQGKFGGLTSLRTISGTDRLDTSQMTDMSYLFAGATKLEKLDLASFNTSNVTDMKYMFYNDASLKSLNVGSFDTSKVTNFTAMFSDNSGLTDLDISNFVTDQALGKMDRMLWETGNKGRFVLTLGRTKFDTNTGIATMATGIKAVGTGTPTLPSGSSYTTDELQALYGGDLAQVPVKESYIITRLLDNERYQASGKRITVTTGQSKINEAVDEIVGFVDITDNSLKTTEELKGLVDYTHNGNNTIVEVSWIPNKAMTKDYQLVDGGAVVDLAGNLDPDIKEATADQLGNAVIKISYGDGTKKNLPIMIAKTDPVQVPVPEPPTPAEPETPTPDKPLPVATEKKLKHNAYVYNQHGKRIGKKVIRKNQSVMVLGTKTINGKKYYTLGNDQYLRVSNFAGIEARLTHNAYIYDQNGKRLGKKVLRKKSLVKTYGTKTIKNKKYGILSHGGYVKLSNFK